MFENKGEKILVVVNGVEVLFGSTAFGAQLATIEGLQLSYEGTIKEHPDLKEDPEWKSKGVSRFTEKLNSFKTEEERAEYIIEDLRKHYFVPIAKQRKGFRPERIQ